MLIGFAPGGATDIAGRILSERMSQTLGQTIVIENRAGAGGQIALEAGATAAPDGYTLNFTNGGAVTILPVLNRVGFDTLRDFAAVGTVAKQPLVLVASPQLGVSDFAGLRKKLVAEPDKHAFGSAGIGTNSHLGPAYISQLIGTKMTHVEYKGTAQAITDLVSGRLAIHVDAISVVGDLMKSNKLIGIAVLDNDRVAGLNLPTIVQAGLPEYLKYDWSSWFMVVAPKATPSAVVDRLNRDMAVSLKDPEVVKRYAAIAMTPTWRTPAESIKYLEEQVKAWPPLFKQMGLITQ